MSDILMPREQPFVILFSLSQLPKASAKVQPLLTHYLLKVKRWLFENTWTFHPVFKKSPLLVKYLQPILKLLCWRKVVILSPQGMLVQMLCRHLVFLWSQYHA